METLFNQNTSNFNGQQFNEPEPQNQNFIETLNQNFMVMLWLTTQSMQVETWKN